MDCSPLLTPEQGRGWGTQQPTKRIGGGREPGVAPDRNP
jgi:hypothetical protein